MRFKLPLALLVFVALAGGGWVMLRSKINATAVAGTPNDSVKPHQSEPPHGGAPVVLGDEQFCVELVRDAPTGTLKAYFLDGEMENYVRLSAKALDIEVEQGGRKEVLKLMPVADPATGETVGDTSLFQTQTGWLQHTDHFKGIIKNLAIQDQKFQSVDFAFPEGNEKDQK